MTKVKICGIMNQSDLEHALLAGADAVGFVVEIKGSRHKITAETAKELIMHVPIFVKSVAVIAPNDLGDAMRLARSTGADILQLHGTLSMEEIKALKEIVPQKVIAAVPSESMEAYRLDKVADAVLLDTFKDGLLGGSGTVHDWNLSAAVVRNTSVPVILAGGLNSFNVSDAIRKVRPYAVDVSSGVETDGRKDPIKIESFMREVRSCP